jgi:CSLREA domain-containing protein
MFPNRVPRNFTRLFNSIVIFILLATVFAFPQPAHARTLVVNSLLDDDDGVCDHVHCTLREAINAAGSGDVIWISIPTGSAPWEIVLDSELPPIWQRNLIIDATPMPSYLGGPSVVLVGNDDIEYGFLLEGESIRIRGFQFRGFRGGRNGAGVVTTGIRNLIEGNSFINNEYGIVLESHENIVRDNYIGVTPGDHAGPNDEDGILILDAENDIENNVIAYNGGHGIYIGPSERYLFNNTFTRNSMYDNEGLGIEVGRHNAAIDLLPILTDVGLTEVSGSACAACVIELFLAAPDPSEYGEGQTFIGEGVAGDDGSFTISLDAPLSDCDPVTATGTSPHGYSTSEFSRIDRAGLCMMVEMPPISEPYLTVNTIDDGDDGWCNEEHCSLREAINYANRHHGPDEISFDIPGAGPHEILLSGDPLPWVTNDETVIDGSTEPDYAGSPVVWIVNDGSWGGLTVSSERNTISALGITGFGGEAGAGLFIIGGFNSVADNVLVGNGTGIGIQSYRNNITGNYVGIMPDGTAMSNYIGISVRGNNNQIGLPGAGNFISGNRHDGIHLHESDLSSSIKGNLIGIDPSLTVAVPNGRHGIGVFGDANIGGLDSGAGNIIFGNGEDGIFVAPDVLHVQIAGNIIAQNGAYGIDTGEWRGIFSGITITQNSIYDNDELGIETNRADDHIADLRRASLTSVSGTVSCPSCTVELFLAAPDPTGYGEGQTYLGETTTDLSGAFTFELSGVGICDEITATVTDDSDQTSEFSRNTRVACLRMPGWTLTIIGTGGVLILVILVEILRRRGRVTSRWALPATAGGGLLALVLVLGGAALRPDVQLDFGPPSVPRPDPQPLCSEYLDPDGYAPSADQLFGLDEDPAMSWTPGADAPADVEWLVEVRAPDQRLYTLSTTETSVQLSDFQLEPRAGARFDWSVRMLAEGETACWPETWQNLWFENPVIEAFDELPDAEPEDQEPEDDEACTPTAVALMNATCRQGPSSDYAELGFLLEGDAAEILGRTADWTWWYISLMEGQQVCWVSAELVEAECTDELQVIAAPSPPTETPTSPPPAADTTAPPVPSPISPTGGTTLACSSSALLTWSTVNDPSGISGYTVEVQRSADQVNWSGNPGSPATIADDKTTIQVDCGWYYRWRVRATDGAGNSSAWSNWATFAVTLN